ncbi:MAG: carbohydrate kinase family protein [Trueperaceae bacterium]
MATALWVVGDYAWDVLIRTNAELLAGGDTFGEVSMVPGGSAANTAVWARRCGLATTFVGKVGRDRLGDLAEEELTQEGVRAWLVRSDTHATGSVAVWIDHTGQRSMVSGKGADHYLLPSELPRDQLASADHLHLSAWSFFGNPPRTAARAAARLAKEGGATTSLDPGSFQLIEQVGVDRFVRFTNDLEIDLLFPNLDEGRVLSGERAPDRIVAALAERYPGTRVVLKLDAKGAYLLDEDGAGVALPPRATRLLDATGAGDSFAGAFLAHWTRHGDPVAAGRFANDVSSWVIEHLGARPEPDARLWRRIDRFALPSDGDDGTDPEASDPEASDA